MVEISPRLDGDNFFTEVPRRCQSKTVSMAFFQSREFGALPVLNPNLRPEVRNPWPHPHTGQSPCNEKPSCPTRLTRPSTFVALQYQSFFSVRKRDYFEAVLHLVGPPVLTLLLAPCIGPKPVRSGRKAWFWWKNTAAVQKSSLRLFAMALGRFSAIQQRQNSTKIIEKLGARRSVEDGWQLLCSFVCWWLSALERFTEWWKSFD